MENYRLVICKNPFNRREHETTTVPFVDGITISGVLEMCSLPTDLQVSVSRNGKIVSKDLWDIQTIHKNDMLTIIPIVEGGGDNSMLRMALMVALTIVVALIAPGPFFAMAMMVVGGLLINLLLPPTQPKGPDAAKTTQAYSWNPATTQQEGVVVVRYYGVNKATGNIIAGYITTDGIKQTLNVLVDLGQGPIKQIGWNPYTGLSSFTINDQPAENFKSVEFTTRLGNMDQTLIPSFDNTPIVQSFMSDGLFNNDTGAITRTVGAIAGYDAMDIDLFAPNGLWHTNANGEPGNHHVDVKVELSKDGGAWFTISSQSVSETILTVTGGKWSAGKYIDGMEGASVWFEMQAGSTTFTDHTPGEAYGVFPDNGTWQWFDTSEWVTSVTQYDYVTMKSKNSTPYHKILRVDNMAHGSYRIRITKMSSPDKTGNTAFSEACYLNTVTTWLYDDFTYPRTAMVAIKALATDQLSSSLNFTCVLEGAIVRVYRSSQWYSEYSNNPAWVCFDILTQPVFDNSLNIVRYDGINPSRLDLVKFKEWADYCDELVPDGYGGTEKRCLFDGAFDSETSMWEAALQVCSVSRASLIWSGMYITVAIDKAQTVPVQLFTVGNTNNDSFHETFLPFVDRASQIEADYIDKDIDFERSKAIISNDSLTSKSSKVTVQTFGVIRSSQVWRECMYMLNKNQYIVRTGSIDVDIDALACTIGDLIYIQHDVPQWGEGGRVVSATFIAITLDKEVTIGASGSYEIMVRLSDDTFITKSIVQATNYILQSQTFGNASWTKTNGAVTSNAIAAPDGTTTADLFLETTANGYHALVQSIAKTGTAKTYTATVYVHAGPSSLRNYCMVRFTNAAGTTYTQGYVTLSTRAVTSRSNVTFGVATITTSDAGGGWVKIVFTAVSDTGTALYFHIGSASSSSSGSYAGNASYGIYVWGAQLEESSTNHSYIPTTTEAITVNEPGLTNVLYVSDMTSIPQQFDVYTFGIVGQSSKPFVITAVERKSELQAILQLVEYNALIYATDAQVPVIPSILNNTVDPLPPVTDIVLSSILVFNTGGTLQTNINGGFAIPSNRNYASAEIWFKSSNQTWTYAGRTTTNEFTISNVTEGYTYTVAIVTVNKDGNKIPYTSAPYVTVYAAGKLTPPSDVADLSVSVATNGIRLDWSSVSDIDLDYYLVRYSPDVSATWLNAVDVMRVYGTSITLPAALDGTYFVKAVDTSGFESNTAVSYYTTIPSMINFNAKKTITCETAWTGTKVNTTKVGNNLELTAGTSTGEGTFEVAYTDLGTVQTCRCWGSATWLGVSTSAVNVDSMGMIDSIENWDGVVTGVGVELQIATTQDNPAGTPTWSAWMPLFIGDFTARAYKFKARLYSLSATNYVRITNLSFTIDMPDRIESNSGVSLASGGTSISFTLPFMITPAVYCNIQSAASGDTIIVTSISSTGFTAKVVDSAGSNKTATIDWFAKGY